MNSNRPVGDLLILMISGTVCLAVLATGAGVFLVEVAEPSRDTTDVVSALRDLVGTLIGLVAGYLAGRARSPEPRRPGTSPARGGELPEETP